MYSADCGRAPPSLNKSSEPDDMYITMIKQTVRVIFIMEVMFELFILFRLMSF
ncbi:hypothetical protein D9M69_652050 [compost metagenome]